MKKVCLSLVLWSVATCHAQTSHWKDYRYLRPLTGVRDTWHSLTLNDSLFRRLQPSLTDIRIIRVNNGGDTAEVPYMLTEQRPGSSLSPRKLKVINNTYREGIHYLTLDLGSAAPAVNQLALDFGQDNFDWRCTLEGSQDLLTWERLLGDQRILSISNPHTDYAFTNIHFRTTRFRYLRIGIRSDREPELRSVTVNELVETAGLQQRWPVKTSMFLNGKPDNTSVAEVMLPLRVPVNRIRLLFADSLDYFRKVSIGFAHDSIRTDQGVQYFYTDVFHGYVSSLESNDFPLPGVLSNRLRISLFHEDNAPLQLDSVLVFGNVHELIIRAPVKEEQYYLLYGNKKAQQPRYDLSNFTSAIPGQRAALVMGRERDVSRVITRKKPLLESNWWLWGVMMAIIALIGTFSLRMLRSSPE